MTEIKAQTLTEFLAARIDEDEAIAQDALHSDAKRPGEWVTEHHNSQYHDEPDRCHIAEDSAGHYWSVAHEVYIPNAEHMARHDPARVLAECEVKRRIVDLAREARETQRAGYGAADYYMRDVLRLLALPYADHPDYRQEWKP